jgi:hypothetical protein
MNGSQKVLNAEDFYATLVLASRRYFDDVRSDATLQSRFLESANDPDTGVLTVGPASGAPKV